MGGAPNVTRNRRSPKYVENLEMENQRLRQQLEQVNQQAQQMQQQFQQAMNGEQRHLRLVEVGSLETIAKALYVQNREAIDAYTEEEEARQAEEQAAAEAAAKERAAKEVEARQAEEQAAEIEELDQAIESADGDVSAIAPGAEGECIECGATCVNDTTSNVPEDRLTCFECQGRDENGKPRDEEE